MKTIVFKFIKRAIDLSVALSLLLLLSPVLVLTMLAIVVFEGKPVFYVSRRHASVDGEIPIVKFRTMVRDATSPKYNLHGRFMQDGYLDIPTNHEVYTGIGRLLEKSQLVEILQLLNVIVHGMSLIGNRPLPSANLEHLKKLSGWQERFASPAGMTGISQVVGKYNLEPNDRIELEKLYSKVYNEGNVLKCDMIIAFFTIRLIIRGKTMSIAYARNLLESCL